MRKLLMAAVALMFCSTLYADCREHALEGDWTVFYRDNAFPTSVLAPDEFFSIRYNAKSDKFSIDLTDPAWKAWNGRWSHECIDGQTVLIGAVEQRHSGAILVIEVSRVLDVNDLMARRSGQVKLNQINIHFPERYARSYPPELQDALTQAGPLLSHPGHAHADD